MEGHRRATAKILSVSAVNTFARARDLFLIKSGKQRNSHFLDRMPSTQFRGKRSDGNRLPRHYDFRALNEIAKTFLVLRAGYFKYLASVKWRAAIWQSIKDTTSRRERRRSSNNQCKHRTNGSTQFYKAVARPASKH